MASSILHIKDSYYFEIPKALARANYQSKEAFPDVWVRLDEDYQNWEADRFIEKFEPTIAGLSLGKRPSAEQIKEQWLHAKAHDHVHFARPLPGYLEHLAKGVDAEYQKWKALPENKEKGLTDFCASHPSENNWIAQYLADVNKSGAAKTWASLKKEANDVAAYKQDSAHKWSEQKIAAYNKELSGKILIPQVFGGQLRNFYERESGICISKFMVVELIVAVLMIAVFSWLASKVGKGGAPKGRLANMLEALLIYFRDNVVRPIIGGDHDEHGHDHSLDPDHAPGGHAAEAHAAGHHHDHAHDHGGHAAADKKKHSLVAANPADAYLPLIWTLFLFVLFCNLMGMLPWVGAPTGAFGATTGLAFVTFSAVVFMGMRTFGFIGFFVNQIPSMDLPWYIAIIIKPMLFLIEMLGLLIKHAVLAIRLVANMVAGHLVILALMAIGISLEAAASSMWPLSMSISVLSSTVFNLLELLVAFLQAFLFALLSSLFIGAAIHKH